MPREYMAKIPDMADRQLFGFSLTALKDARERPAWCSAARWRMELGRRRQNRAAPGGKSNGNRNGGETILVTTTRR